MAHSFSCFVLPTNFRSNLQLFPIIILFNSQLIAAGYEFPGIPDSKVLATFIWFSFAPQLLIVTHIFQITVQDMKHLVWI